ncbi:hypothetical protein MICRO11B_50028 [Micrococcus luteus]|nr:hypothetical protein MICRO11B_50028 [Micrococcus luteus]
MAAAGVLQVPGCDRRGDAPPGRGGPAAARGLTPDAIVDETAALGALSFGKRRPPEHFRSGNGGRRARGSVLSPVRSALPSPR